MSAIISTTLLLAIQHASGAPNIIMMIADDIGWNDVGFTSMADSSTASTDTSTPYLNKLARETGIVINNYYVHRMCSPSRAAFLSGRLAHRYAFDTHLLLPNLALSLSRQLSVVSSEFQAAGYRTHAIGKWHMGFQSEEYTPTYRGFDSFYGYWTAGVDYYNSESVGFAYKGTDYTRHDLRSNLDTVTLSGDKSDYSVFRFRDQAIDIIEDTTSADADKPFFMYLAWQSSHTPSEAPDAYYSQYSDSALTTERAYNQAQTTSMDDAIGAVVESLKSSDKWSDTILIWASDNGAEDAYGDNFPLRGYKHTLFEGGIRVPAFISGGYLDDELHGTSFGTTSWFMHVVDWYPTLLDMAGIEVSHALSTMQKEDAFVADWIDSSVTVPLDGVSQWGYMIGRDTLDDDAERVMIMDVVRDSSMTEMVNGTVRWGRWKYVKGLGNTGYHKTTWTWGEEDEQYVYGEDRGDMHLWGRDFAVAREDDEVGNALGCDLDQDVVHLYCFESEGGCLFDLESDPCEYVDLSKTHSDVTQKLSQMLVDVMDELPFDPSTAGIYLSLDTAPYWLPESDDEFWSPYQPYSHVLFEPLLFDHWSQLYASDKQQESVAVAVGAVGVSAEGVGLEFQTVLVMACILSGLVVYVAFRRWRIVKKVDEKSRLVQDVMDIAYGTVQ